MTDPDVLNPQERAAVTELPATRHGLVGAHPVLLQAIELAERAASGSVPVLLQGEHGTGRETLARVIHLIGRRRALPFICLEALEALDYPPTEAEAPLQQLIHARARGGTLFVRSIEGSSRRLQAALAMLLAEGAADQSPRVIASTCVDLADLAGQGRFDPRLLYALRACTLSLPPLRGRGGDLDLLLQHFARQRACARGIQERRFSERALAALRAYAWPGNVHELRCIVERLVDLSETELVDLADLPPLVRVSNASMGAPYRPLAEVTTEYVAAVFAATGSNVSRSAELLGITRKTLREKLKRARPESPQGVGDSCPADGRSGTTAALDIKNRSE